MEDDIASAGMEDRLAARVALLHETFSEKVVDTPGGAMSFRTCGSGAEDTIVLLHGIGSGAASWLPCARTIAGNPRIIAWNAPGYGQSAPLSQSRPDAGDYAERLENLLDALDVRDCMLVGHSLGALIAAAYVSSVRKRVSRLVLLSPAQGYAAAGKVERSRQVEEERLSILDTIGIEGMAERSPARMLSEGASSEAKAWVRWNSLQLKPEGYRQAVRMLCSGDIRRYRVDVPCRMACGDLDVITPPEESRLLAAFMQVPFSLIRSAGHACYVEQPEALADFIAKPVEASSKA